MDIMVEMSVEYDEVFLARFHKKYAKQDGCWLWLGGKDRDGYGMVKFCGRQFRAHRVMYEIATGPIPRGLIVMHTCDNPGCVNSQHLLTGTYKDNTQDMIRKGRKHLTIGSKAQRGTLNGKARLTEDDVREIRRRHAAGEMQIDLGPEFGITQGAVHKVISRRTWKHVDEDYGCFGGEW